MIGCLRVWHRWWWPTRRRRAPSCSLSGILRVENPAPGEGLSRVLSLKGRRHKGRVMRRGGWLAFEPGEFFVCGMSGSPIVDGNGAAIGVVSVSQLSPVILDSLSTQLVRGIVVPAPPVPRCSPPRIWEHLRGRCDIRRHSAMSAFALLSDADCQTRA